MNIVNARVFVVDMQRRGHSFGDDAGVKAAGRVALDAALEDQLDLFGAS